LSLLNIRSVEHWLRGLWVARECLGLALVIYAFHSPKKSGPKDQRDRATRIPPGFSGLWWESTIVDKDEMSSLGKVASSEAIWGLEQAIRGLSSSQWPWGATVGFWS
jgi:hypothetical protein